MAEIEYEPTVFDTVVDIGGVEVRKIGGVWCELSKAGTWRDVRWFGRITVPALLDLIAGVDD